MRRFLRSNHKSPKIARVASVIGHSGARPNYIRILRKKRSYEYPLSAKELLRTNLCEPSLHSHRGKSASFVHLKFFSTILLLFSNFTSRTCLLHATGILDSLATRTTSKKKQKLDKLCCHQIIGKEQQLKTNTCIIISYGCEVSYNPYENQGSFTCSSMTKLTRVWHSLLTLKPKHIKLYSHLLSEATHNRRRLSTR